MDLHFVKMHGLGNDFVVIEDLESGLDLSPEAVSWFCDRNFGVGADGLILVRPASDESADFSWWFRNSDGSVAEMCGNGIRCFAKYVVDHGLVASDAETVRVETAVGVMTASVSRDENGRMASATVDMGEPRLTPAEIPVTLDCEDPENPVIACPLATDLGTFDVTCVSMGNPHCVIVVPDVESAPVETVGPLIENHTAFPQRTNVEFVEVADDEVLRLRVWERGVGETLACGTGACAATVAMSLTCRIGREATVELPGGDLEVRWGENGHVYMTGPAEEVFSGTVVIEDDD